MSIPVIKWKDEGRGVYRSGPYSVFYGEQRGWYMEFGHGFNDLFDTKEEAMLAADNHRHELLEQLNSMELDA